MPQNGKSINSCQRRKQSSSKATTTSTLIFEYLNFKFVFFCHYCRSVFSFVSSLFRMSCSPMKLNPSAIEFIPNRIPAHHDIGYESTINHQDQINENQFQQPSYQRAGTYPNYTGHYGENDIHQQPNHEKQYQPVEYSEFKSIQFKQANHLGWSTNGTGSGFRKPFRQSKRQNNQQHVENQALTHPTQFNQANAQLNQSDPPINTFNNQLQFLKPILQRGCTTTIIDDVKHEAGNQYPLIGIQPLNSSCQQQALPNQQINHLNNQQSYHRQPLSQFNTASPQSISRHTDLYLNSASLLPVSSECESISSEEVLRNGFLIVIGVVENGAAAQSGLKSGDIILKVNRKMIVAARVL